jgi:hypothetical protein
MKNTECGPNIVVSGAAILAGLLTGCSTYVGAPPPQSVVVMEQPAPPVYAPPPQTVVVAAPAPPPPVYVAPAATPDVVEIHAASDFYAPLQPYGQWVDVPGYGRCWTPANVDSSWRPYADGHWERTDAGWYWVSDERWGWATYHYGRWHRDLRIGWVWVPQTEWAPAWVAWRDGGGYTGWAPLPPEARFDRDRGIEFHDADIDRSGFVFVRQEQLLESHRHQDVIVNNVTIINRTVNITKINVVNHVIVADGPRPEVVARVTGRKVEAVPVHDLRVQQETRVIARPNGPAGVGVHPVVPNGNPAPPPVVANPVHPVANNPETRPVHPATEPAKPANQSVRPATQPVQPAKVVVGQPKPGTSGPANPAGENHRETVHPGTQPGQPAKVGNAEPNHPQAHPTNPSGTQPGQPAKVGGPANPSAAPGHEAKPAGTPALTPQQKLDQQKNQKPANKRPVTNDKAHPSSTNAPAGPPGH